MPSRLSSAIADGANGAADKRNPPRKIDMAHGLKGLKETGGIAKKAVAESKDASSVEKKTGGKGKNSNWPGK